MAIPDVIKDYRYDTGISQKELAAQLHIDNTHVSKIEKGTREWPDHLDASLSKVNWRFALALIEERTGGWIKNRFGDVDPTPAALQLQFVKEMKEANEALEAVILSTYEDWSKRDEQLAKVEKEIKDVVERGMILVGTIQDIRKQAKKGGRQ